MNGNLDPRCHRVKVISPMTVFLLALIVNVLWWLCGCSTTQCRLSFGAATAADAGTTYAGLQRGYQEGNPVLQSNPVLLTVAASVVLYVVAEYLIAHGHVSAGRNFLRVGAALHGAAAAWNVNTILKGRK